MFLQARLNNFRQHRERAFDFAPGLNAVRGLNERGKTSLLEALAYCMFGAQIGLRESVDKVVTWGEKANSLKVEMDYEVNGTVYTGKRSPKGAEVWVRGGVAPLVTGQSECTKFWESLLGVSAKVASNLMLANQQSIRGALEGGSNAPVALIETLANFKLIDHVISLVKDQLPNGNTKLIEDRISVLQAKADEPAEADEVPQLQERVETCQNALNGAESVRLEAQQACDDHGPAAQAAQNAVNEAQRKAQAVSLAEQAVERARREQVDVPAAPDTSRVEELRAQVRDAQRLTRAAVAHAALQALGVPEVEWDEGLAALQDAKTAARGEHARLVTTMSTLKERRASAIGRIIKDKQCAFCQKDLSEVPEVVTHNKALSDELEQIEAHIREAQAAIDEWAGTHDAYEEVLAEGRRRQSAYQKHAEFITLDEKYVPARWTWAGPDLAQKVDGDPAEELRRIEAAQRAHDQAAGRRAQAEEMLAQAEKSLQELQTAKTAAEALSDRLQPDRVRAEELASAVAVAEARVREAREAHESAAWALNTAQAVRREREAARARQAADLQAAKADLEATVKGNRLLAKLQAARPQIADKLWKVVLASVSTYFSQIRGVPSVVTRADNGFQVDGRDIEGLSGSTLDALGLAIRVALTKTFLPNARVLVLDEPAAACDDAREANMIGLVAAADFDQVLLVTHSALCDAYAAQVIQL